MHDTDTAPPAPSLSTSSLSMSSSPLAPRTAPQRRAGALRRRLTAGLIGLASLSLLAGCGGGVSIGIVLTPGDDPPQVRLDSSLGSAFEGERIDLSASATDDHRVSTVQVWQSNDRTVSLLAEVRGSALGVVTAMPFAPSGIVYYKARAVDDAGQVNETPWRPVSLLR